MRDLHRSGVFFIVDVFSSKWSLYVVTLYITGFCAGLALWFVALPEMQQAALRATLSAYTRPSLSTVLLRESLWLVLLGLLAASKYVSPLALAVVFAKAVLLGFGAAAAGTAELPMLLEAAAYVVAASSGMSVWHLKYHTWARGYAYVWAMCLLVAVASKLL